MSDETPLSEDILIIELPKDKDTKKGLRDILAGLKRQALESRSRERRSDANCKVVILETLFRYGRVNALALRARMSKVYNGHFDDFNHFEEACGSIKRWCKVGSDS